MHVKSVTEKYEKMYPSRFELYERQ